MIDVNNQLQSRRHYTTKCVGSSHSRRQLKNVLELEAAARWPLNA